MGGACRGRARLGVSSARCAVRGGYTAAAESRWSRQIRSLVGLSEQKVGEWLNRFALGRLAVPPSGPGYVQSTDRGVVETEDMPPSARSRWP